MLARAHCLSPGPAAASASTRGSPAHFVRGAALNNGRRRLDRARISLTRARAVSETSSPSDASDVSGSSGTGTDGSGASEGEGIVIPSLHDYDGAQYARDIHDQGAIPRLERAINKVVIESAVLVIDKLYEGRNYPRFYALETVARVPYFSFLSVLHLYETLGFWRRADYLKVHFAQTMNEFHHLLIMESLGGDRKFTDRFFAQHMAVAYFGIACLMYLAGWAKTTNAHCAIHILPYDPRQQ